MSEEPLQNLSDLAGEAHARIQAVHESINPVVGVRRGMREVGIPADVMTIDCPRSRRRILLVLHDEEPGKLLYQFTDLSQEAGEDFQRMALSEVESETLVRWMEAQFGAALVDDHCLRSR